MQRINVLTLIGGISSHSINKHLYNEIIKYSTGNLSFQTFDISALPFYSQDLEKELPESVKMLKELAQHSDAILLITPEYNRSIPGVLKNAIDWGTRPHGTNSWNSKPTAIMGASMGNIGTFGAQQHLRNICSYANMRIMSQPEFYFNASSGMTENGLTEYAIKMTRQFLGTFEEWIKFHNK